MEGKSGGKIWREIWLVYVGECTLGTVLWLLYVGKCTLGDTDLTCLEGQKNGVLNMLRETKAGATFASHTISCASIHRQFKSLRHD